VQSVSSSDIAVVELKHLLLPKKAERKYLRFVFVATSASSVELDYDKQRVRLSVSGINKAHKKEGAGLD
jgi:hypothetical protein